MGERRQFLHNSAIWRVLGLIESHGLNSGYSPSPLRKDDGLTGKDVRAAEVNGITFPQLLAPMDNLPPATLTTSVPPEGARQMVRGISHDDGEIAIVSVNGHPATITTRHAGIADWVITLDAPSMR